MDVVDIFERNRGWCTRRRGKQQLLSLHVMSYFYCELIDCLLQRPRQEETRNKSASSARNGPATPVISSLLLYTKSYIKHASSHGHECLLHEGTQVLKGVKYVLRSDVMFVD